MSRRVAPAPRSSGESRRTSNVLRVLLVEDNAVDVLVVSAMLKEAGAAQPAVLTQAGSLAEALASYERLRPDVVLLDLSLPDAADLDGLRAFLDRAPDAAVVVLTGETDDQLGETAVAAGAQDFLVKEGLTGASLRRVLRYARGRREALRASEERYRRIIEGALDAVITTDSEGRIIDWNARAEAMFGWPRAEALGRLLYQTVFPAAPGRIGPGDPSFWIRVSTVPAVGEVRLTTARRRDGTDIPVEVAVSATSQDAAGLYTAFVRDVTELRRSEARSLAASNLAADLIRSMPGIFALVDPSGRVLRWNQNVERILGYTAEEIAAITVLDFVRPSDRALAAERMAEVFHRGESSQELSLRRKDGSAVQFYLKARRVEIDGAPRMLLTGLDVTERRQMEAQLVHAQKLESIGRLAGGVAHDFNNVLAAVLSFSDLVLMDSAPDDPRRPDVETIREAALRATGLTRQLLAFSRRQVFSPEVCDLNELIAGLDRMLRRLIGSDVELATLFGEELGAVEVDPGQIESAIVNMAINARDAMPEGGVLTIQTQNVGDSVRITVSDTGCGMTDDVLQHVFEPFFTTKEPGKGTGLGLASAYGIVRQSGGQISVTSAPGKGSKFIIDLPMVDAATHLASRRPSGSLPGGTETIIVAEDNDLVRRGVTAMLAARGYQVLPATCGEDAVGYADRHPGPIHLLLADVVMPRMSARELREAMLARRPGTRVLLMSGYVDESARSAGVAVEDFLHKPFTAEALAIKVRELLDRP